MTRRVHDSPEIAEYLVELWPDPTEVYVETHLKAEEPNVLRDVQLGYNPDISKPKSLEISKDL